MNFRNEEDKNVDLQNIIRTVFIDLPSEYNITYNFTKYPPKISGQIGVPLIIDSLLGNVMVISSNETNKIILKYIFNSSLLVILKKSFSTNNILW